MHTDVLHLFAPAKLNLTLDVLGRRADGYHELRSIMASVDLYDEIGLAPAGEISLTWEGSMPAPRLEKNTAYLAARAFFAQTGRACRIHINKRIPGQAGLGGGSADAAAVLRGLQRLYGGIEDEVLLSLARAIGADVPFCLLGGCALAEGIGDKLTSLPAPQLHLVLLKGRKGVSTPALFRSLQLPVPHPDTQAALAALSGPAGGLAPFLQNALEGPATALLPEIGHLKARLLAAGALAAFMSGSGACVAGLFPSESAARAALPNFVDVPFHTVCRTGAFAL
ncbi:MAG: 4-(cytidine 5'-diphospho)-2-C-methyl-D-erythritol kinase [Candidatus Pelethousia sp.]|nr:4-(cytidine 5'-diphospho)-2-C-methyl-D-erythritol kinase [Candidatus Pelethousia sp.]